jgi:dihydrofolate reductase
VRKLIYSFMVSLDGYIAGPGNDLSWPLIDEEIHTFVNAQERETGTMLNGRRLWELMQPFWSVADQDPQNPPVIQEYAKIWQAAEKVVFSRTLESVEGNARLARGDVVEEVRRLKALPGKNISVGGAELAEAVVRAGLVDEYSVYVHPLLLGGGTPMFPKLDQQVNLKLEETHRFGSGVVFLRYSVVQKQK